MVGFTVPSDGTVDLDLDLSSNVQIGKGLKALMPSRRVNVHLLQACIYSFPAL